MLFCRVRYDWLLVFIVDDRTPFATSTFCSNSDPNTYRQTISCSLVFFCYQYFYLDDGSLCIVPFWPTIPLIESTYKSIKIGKYFNLIVIVYV